MANREIEVGAVRVFDALIGDSKAQAVKVLEEAAEVVEAWKDYDACRDEAADRGNDPHEDMAALSALGDLADEVADVIQAACNLAYACGINMRAAMDRCEERNKARGRIDG